MSQEPPKKPSVPYESSASTPEAQLKALADRLKEASLAYAYASLEERDTAWAAEGRRHGRTIGKRHPRNERGTPSSAVGISIFRRYKIRLDSPCDSSPTRTGSSTK